MGPIRQRLGSRLEDIATPHRLPPHQPAEPDIVAPKQPTANSPDALLRLQRTRGNAYTRQMLTQQKALQRQPQPKLKGVTSNKGNTITWANEEVHRGRSRMRRSTKIEADAWGEVGPAPARVKYRREINLMTADGADVYVDIRGVVRLPKGVPLPATPEAALDTSGMLVQSQLTFRVEGGDFEPVNEYKSNDVRSLSLMKVTGAVFPDYAQLPLSIERQEDAILRHLQGLKRRPKKPKEEEGGITAADVAEVVVDIGTDFIPVVGELKDAYRAITGKDPLTGRSLHWWERILSGVFAIPFVGKLLKGIGKGLKALGEAGKFLGGKLLHYLGPKVGRLKEWFFKKFFRRPKRITSGTTHAGADVAKRTGTVWDKIHPVTGAPIRPYTVIPQFFELETAGGRFFINSNATKHMEELVAGSIDKGGKAAHLMEMRSQEVLTSFAEAVELAEKQGIKWGEIMNVGPWELIFEKVGKNGPLPVVKHAVYR